MTLKPVCENVETAQGVPLTVTGVAQVGHDPHYYPQCHHPSQSILGEENEEP